MTTETEAAMIEVLREIPQFTALKVPAESVRTQWPKWKRARQRIYNARHKALRRANKK